MKSKKVDLMLTVMALGIMSVTATPLASGHRMMSAADEKIKRSDGKTTETWIWAAKKFRDKFPPQLNSALESKEKFLEWKKAGVERTRGKAYEKVPENPEFKLLKEEPRDGYTLKTYEFYPFEKLAVKTMILVPDNAKLGKTPMMICMPGSGGSLEVVAGEQCRHIGEAPLYVLRNRQAWWFMKVGMIGVALENPANANNAQEDMIYWKSQLKYREYASKLGFWDDYISMRCIAYIINFMKHDPLLDAKKIGVSGLSLGAQVISAAITNPDVAACCYNDFYCNHQARLAATTELMSNGRRCGGASTGDNKLLVCPKPLLMNEGGIYKGGLEDLIEAYKLMGCPENLTIHHYDKFADPKNRKYDHLDLRSYTGLTPMGFFEATNVDPDDHSFHSESALPWICKVFYGSEKLPDESLWAEINKAHAEKKHTLKELFPPDGKQGALCYPHREDFCDKDYEFERPDGRTEKTMVWAAYKYRTELLPKVLALREKFKLLETRGRDGFKIEVYEMYPEDILAVKLMILIPQKVRFAETPISFYVGEDGESIESLAGEADPYETEMPYPRALRAVKRGRIAVALAAPGEANGAPDDIASEDSRKIFDIYAEAAGWSADKLIDLEKSMITDFLRGR